MSERNRTLADDPLPSGWHVCPRCDGDGTDPGHGSRLSMGRCQRCQGESIVAHAAYVRFGNAHIDQTAYHSGVRQPRIAGPL